VKKAIRIEKVLAAIRDVRKDVKLSGRMFECQVDVEVSNRILRCQEIGGGVR